MGNYGENSPRDQDLQHRNSPGSSASLSMAEDSKPHPLTSCIQQASYLSAPQPLSQRGLVEIKGEYLTPDHKVAAQ